MAGLHMLFAYMHFLDPQQVNTSPFTRVVRAHACYQHAELYSTDVKEMDCDALPIEPEPSHSSLLALQAADIIFSNTQPIDPLQIPLHRVMATGYAAAAHTFWTLKASNALDAHMCIPDTDTMPVSSPLGFTYSTQSN